jgi:hypothetical protein
MYTNNKGVSNSLIAVLIVVALMVVIAATVIVVDGAQKASEKAAITGTHQESSGLIQLKIAGPTHRSSGTTGLVTLSIE